MPSITARSLKVQGRPARVWRGGTGPALLLLHGGLGDAHLHWASVWDSLAHSFTIAAPDLPGFGESAPLPDASFSALRDWVGDVREALGFPRVILAGNSFGGAVARLYAADQPVRVMRLILVNGGMLPSPSASRWLGRLLGPHRLGGWLSAQVRWLSFSWAGLRQTVSDSRVLTPGFVARSRSQSAGFTTLIRQAALSALPAAQTPQCATLVLWGEADRLARPARGREVAASIPGARFQTISGAGHLPQIERPAAFVELVRDFAGGGAGRGPVEPTHR